MIGLKKKKKNMEEKLDKNVKSSGETFLAKQLPITEKRLAEEFSQARMIRQPGTIMKFDVEYKPEKDLYWGGGKYLFSYEFPDDYPNSPPKVLCKTKIYHPNIDYDGNVCLNILKIQDNGWTPTLSVMNVIVAVYQLFVIPNPHDPLNHDVAKVMRDDEEQFVANVKKTLRGGYHFGQQFQKFI